MLRILRNDVEADLVVLVLQGHLVAEWAEVLEHECLTLFRSGLRIVLDLSRVGFIGRAGVEVLGRLGRAGAEISGCSPLIAEILEEEGIEVRRNPGDTNDDSAPGKRRNMRES